jgi:chromate transporter
MTYGSQSMTKMGGIDSAAAPAGVAPAHTVSFGEAVRVWARVAALSFGGPAGQTASYEWLD